MDALVVSSILLWLVILIMGVVIFALTRQIGVLYERIAPAGALMLNKQLRVGMNAPEITVDDLDGNQYALGKINEQLKSQLLFFVSPDCPVCKILLPIVRSAEKSESDWLNIMLASDGEADHRHFIKQYKLNRFPYVVSEILGITYGVSKLPYAVLIDEQGKIASMGIINSREHLESLFEAKERKVASIQDYMNQTVAAETESIQKQTQEEQSLYTELR